MFIKFMAIFLFRAFYQAKCDMMKKKENTQIHQRSMEVEHWPKTNKSFIFFVFSLQCVNVVVVVVVVVVELNSNGFHLFRCAIYIELCDFPSIAPKMVKLSDERYLSLRCKYLPD